MPLPPIKSPNDNAKALPPHPATVAQPRRMFAAPIERPPHPATVQRAASHPAKMAQRMEKTSEKTVDDAVGKALLALFSGSYALRSCSSMDDAKKHEKETVRGDAVPLNMAGNYGPYAYVKEVKTNSATVALELQNNAISFIYKCLEWNVTFKKEDNEKKIEEIIRCFDDRPFVLLKGKEGAQNPRDVEKKEYHGLGKCGTTDIPPKAVIGIFGTGGEGLDLDIKFRMLKLNGKDRVDDVQRCIAKEIFNAMMIAIDADSLCVL